MENKAKRGIAKGFFLHRQTTYLINVMDHLLHKWTTVVKKGQPLSPLASGKLAYLYPESEYSSTQRKEKKRERIL